MLATGWARRVQQWRGGPIETDLTPYRLALEAVNRAGEGLAGETDRRLRDRAAALRSRGQRGTALDDLLAECFAVVREAAERVLGMRPFDVQVLAGAALHRGRLVEMQTGEGKTLWRYSSWLEKQRETLHAWRRAVLVGQAPLEACAARAPERYAALRTRFGAAVVEQAERAITLHHIDACWAEHLAFVAHLREGIHLVGIGGQDPLHAFCKQIAEAFRTVHATIEARSAETFAAAEITEDGLDLDRAGVRGPSSTWTYLINDRVLSDLQQMLQGSGNNPVAGAAVLMTWPLLAAWGVWRWIQKRRE